MSNDKPLDGPLPSLKEFLADADRFLNESKRPAKLSLREKHAFDAAWSAVQHSESIDIKAVRRKLSIHDLRTLLQLVVPAVCRAQSEGAQAKVVEECAKVAEQLFFENPHKGTLWGQGWEHACSRIGSHIRSLRVLSPPRQTEE